MPKKLLGLIGLFIIATGLLVSLNLAGKKQDIRKKAAGSGSILSIDPTSLTVNKDDTFSVAIAINTQGDKVSAAELHLTYDQTKLEGQNITAGSYLPEVLHLQGQPESQIGAGTASITLGSGTNQKTETVGILATLTFKTLTPSTSQIEFTADTKVAATGANGNRIASMTESQIIVLVAPTAIPTVTQIPTPTDTPIPTPTPTDNPIPTSTPTPTPSPTPTSTPTPTLTPTNTPSPTSTPTPTATPIPPTVTPEPTSTPTPTSTPIPNPTVTETPIPTFTPVPTPSPIPGDITDRVGNGIPDGVVDIYDYGMLIRNFGRTGIPGFITADILQNGKVDIYDYNILVRNFGRRASAPTITSAPSATPIPPTSPPIPTATQIPSPPPTQPPFRCYSDSDCQPGWTCDTGSGSCYKDLGGGPGDK